MHPSRNIIGNSTFVPNTHMRYTFAEHYASIEQCPSIENAFRKRLHLAEVELQQLFGKNAMLYFGMYRHTFVKNT